MRKWQHRKHAQMAASKTCANDSIKNMRKWQHLKHAQMAVSKTCANGSIVTCANGAREARVPLELNINASHAQGACSSLSSTYIKNTWSILATPHICVCIEGRVSLNKSLSHICFCMGKMRVGIVS